MSRGEFELFEIQCRDFVRNLIFLQKQSGDFFIREILEDMVINVQRQRRVIESSIDWEEV